ncbi:MAG: cytochrome C oxidase subunit IV family protein, partial [Phycisphaerae bacterium]|nr:cytochrome C oxidase subunit IV family protein [Phycisphaerae bacterium]
MHHHVAEISTYLMVFAALMVLLVATYIAGMLDLDHIANGLNLTVAMIIAVIKASLVVAIFMHVKDGSRLIWIFATAAFFWLMIMIILTLTD